MHATVRPLTIFAFAVATLGSATGWPAVAQNAPTAHPSAPGVAPPSYSGPGWGVEEEPAAPPETAHPADLPVLYVTSVEILRASQEPELDIVRVTGLAASEGWSEPQLVPTYAGKPFDGVLDLELIAIPPDQPETADGFVQLSAILPLAPGQPFKGVRVRGSENAIAVKQIPGASQAKISTNDCASCAGKKFVAEGSTQQPQQSIVRQEDLPKLLRVVKASDGIRETEQNPNRLTLMLDDDDTILEAFWE